MFLQVHGNVAGIAGYNENGTISDCYNNGSISSYQSGGIVGANKLGTVKKCYNLGEIVVKGTYGGIIGGNTDGTVENCYYLNTACTGGINGADIAGQAEVKTEAELKSADMLTLLGNAFTADYAIPINSGYPILSWQ